MNIIHFITSHRDGEFRHETLDFLHLLILCLVAFRTRTFATNQVLQASDGACVSGRGRSDCSERRTRGSAIFYSSQAQQTRARSGSIAIGADGEVKMITAALAKAAV